MKTLKDQFLQVRRSGVPLVAIETADPKSTIHQCKSALENNGLNFPQCLWKESPAYSWDMVSGVNPQNEEATRNQIESSNMAEQFLNDAAKVKPFTILFILNAHRIINDTVVMQAVWNLRDIYKSNGCTLVLIGTAFAMPQELVNDVLILSDPLPNLEEVRKIVVTTLESAKTVPSKKELEKLPQILLGISAFAVEQSVALSVNLRDKTISHEELWERKRRMVESTPGLSVWRGNKETFGSLGGLENVKEYLRSILLSKSNPVSCLGFIDEIEKLFAGAAGDMSGISQDQLRVILTEMQDNEIPGMILIGPPGTGKTALGKAAASLADCEFINIDTGAMTGSLVGESQSKIRAAFKTFRAVSQGHGMFIATCNKIGALPPELRRRFSLGTFYVDLPSKAERDTIWGIWEEKYGIPFTGKMVHHPADEGWTGAEIKACCDVAVRTGQSLGKSAEYIVPVCKSASGAIEALRKQASGCFISASKPGVYIYDGNETGNKHRSMV